MANLNEGYYRELSETLSITPNLFEDHFVLIIFDRIQDVEKGIQIRTQLDSTIEIQYQFEPYKQDEIIIDLVHFSYTILVVEKPKRREEYFVQLMNETTVYEGQWVYIP